MLQKNILESANLEIHEGDGSAALRGILEK
jgi:hypothetical protein